MHTPHSPTIEPYRKHNNFNELHTHLLDKNRCTRYNQRKTHTKENETVKLVFVETSHGSTFVTSFSCIAAFLSLVSWLVSHCLSLCCHLYTKLLHVISFSLRERERERERGREGGREMRQIRFKMGELAVWLHGPYLNGHPECTGLKSGGGRMTSCI